MHPHSTRTEATAQQAIAAAIAQETDDLRGELSEAYARIAMLELRLSELARLAIEGVGGEGRGETGAVGGVHSLPSKNPESVLTVRESSVPISEKKVEKVDPAPDEYSADYDNSEGSDLSPMDNMGAGRWA
jgi:hypothetical protein